MVVAIDVLEEVVVVPIIVNLVPKSDWGSFSTWCYRWYHKDSLASLASTNIVSSFHRHY